MLHCWCQLSDTDIEFGENLPKNTKTGLCTKFIVISISGFERSPCNKWFVVWRLGLSITLCIIHQLLQHLVKQLALIALPHIYTTVPYVPLLFHVHAWGIAKVIGCVICYPHKNRQILRSRHSSKWSMLLRYWNRGFPRAEYSGTAPLYLCSFPLGVVNGMQKEFKQALIFAKMSKNHSTLNFWGNPCF